MPDNCTEIRVYQLSLEAQNRLGGNTEAVLDLPSNFSIRLTKNVERLSVVNTISTEGALGFTLPFSKVNDAVFADWQTPLTLDNQANYYRVSVFVSGYALQFDRLVVKGKTERTETWEVELRRSPEHWIELATQLPINQIDYGLASPNYYDIEQNWSEPEYSGVYSPDDNDSTYWPVMDYGGWCDLTEPPQGTENRVKFIAPEDIRPLISLPYILKRGFCQIGWTIDGVMFDAAWFKRLWVYCLSPTYYDADTTGGRIRGRDFLQRRFAQYSSGTNFLRFSEKIKGTLAESLPNDFSITEDGWDCGIQNSSAISLKYRFILKAEINNDRPLPFTAIFEILEVDETDNNSYTGEIISPPESAITIQFAAGEKKAVSVEIECVLKPNQKGVIGCNVLPNTEPDLFVEPGLYFEVIPLNNCLMNYSNVINIADTVDGNTNLLDWLKATVHLINGRIDTDWETKTITIFPYKTSNVFGSTVPGFLLEESPVVDINGMVISKSIQVKNVRPELKRYTRLEFAESTDAYIESLNLDEPAHSRKLINGQDLPDEIESIINPLFEPTLEGQITLIASGAGGRSPLPYLPRIWDNTEGQRSFNIQPRIFYAYGLIKQKNPNPNLGGTFCDFYWANPVNIAADAPAITQFGYATQLRTLELDPTPSIDANVVFGNEPTDLFTSFYLGLTQTKNGATIDLLMYLQMKDYAQYNFRQLFAFDYNGIPLVVPMTGIRDFAACSEISTPVTFFVEPAESDCCDLPCGCQFTTCEYYQDLGVYMRQDTLNQMRLASFIVDGIELITNPIAFGDVNIIDVDGRPFVTNFVDTFNSVGAPYFTFNISTRVHPERGMRYFKIKHLACVPFRILVTLNGQDCYLYTQAEQKQKFFQGTWEALGYGSTFHSEPIDCETQTEY